MIATGCGRPLGTLNSREFYQKSYIPSALGSIANQFLFRLL
jgi:hypothetical protein